MNRYFASIITIIIYILAGQVCTVLGRAISLDDAVDLALVNNEKIKQYSEKLSQKISEDRQAAGNFLPSLTLEGRYSHLNDPLQIDLDPIRQAIIQLQAGNLVEYNNIYNILGGGSELSSDERAQLYSEYYSQLNGAIPAFMQTFKEQNYPTATLVLTQPIFLGGKLIAAKKASAAEKRASEAEYVKTQNEIVGEAISNFITVILLESVVETRREVLEGMLRHQKDARRLREEGLIAPYHLLRAEVAVADAERGLFDDENNLELSKIALRHILGLSGDEPLETTGELEFREVSDSLEYFRNTALEEQPILKMVTEKRNAAGQKYAVERSDFLPQIAGFGKYELYDKYLSSLEPRWVVGINMSWKLFDGMKNYHRLQAARHLKNEVAYLEAYTRRQIDILVQKNYREMRNSEERYHKLEKTLSLAEENLRLNEERFQTGLGTSLEVIDARLSLEKNRIERLVSLHEYYIALTNLYTAVGEPMKIPMIWNQGEE